MGFEKIKGQEKNVKIIKEALLKGSMGHAVLLEGPTGSGKTTLGFLIAQALNCITGSGDPCDTCLSCKKIEKRVFPDLEFVEPKERWIKLEQIRGAKKNFLLYNQEGKYRIFFIKEAHCLTREAAASLLKIMEEPTEKMKFILTTPAPFRLPATILSRCSRVKTHRLSPELTGKLVKERYPLAPVEKVEIAVRLSGGIPGAAFAIMEDEEWEKRTGEVKEFGTSMVKGNISEAEIMEAAGKWAEREDVLNLLQWLMIFFRDGLLMKAGCRDELLVDHRHLSLWEKCPVVVSALEDCVNIIKDTIKTITTTNANIQLAVENMFLQIKGRLC